MGTLLGKKKVPLRLCLGVSCRDYPEKKSYLTLYAHASSVANVHY